MFFLIFLRILLVCLLIIWYFIDLIVRMLIVREGDFWVLLLKNGKLWLNIYISRYNILIIKSLIGIYEKENRICIRKKFIFFIFSFIF